MQQSELEPNLTEGERNLRDLFVNEYLLDFDPFKACLRLGFLAPYALQHAQTLMNCGYVNRSIAFRTRKLEVDGPDEVSQDKALCINGLRQAAQHGPYASRVSAIGKLAEIRGFSKPDGDANAEQALIDVMREFAQVAPV